MNGTSPVIALDRVTLVYRSGPPWAVTRTEAVRDVSLHVNRGETLGVVGQSGSGKTSLGRMVLNLARPTLGEVRFEGRQFGSDPKRHRGRVQAVLQNPSWSLDPRMRCGRSVAEPLIAARHVPRTEWPLRIARVLERTGLPTDVASRYPHELSGGQQQRVAIARALISDPALIVFDEAVSALDVSVQAQILNLIRELQVDVGFAALFISHDIAATRYVSHRVAAMLDGEVVEIAAARDLYSGASHPYTRRLFGLEPVAFDSRLSDPAEASGATPRHAEATASVARSHD